MVLVMNLQCSCKWYFLKIFLQTQDLLSFYTPQGTLDWSKRRSDRHTDKTRQTSQPSKSELLCKKTFFCFFNEIWKESYQKYYLIEGVIDKGEEGPTNDLGWPLSGQRVSQARMVVIFMFALFIRSFIRSQQDFSVVGRPLLNWKIRRFSLCWRKASYFSQKGGISENLSLEESTCTCL